MNQKAKNLLGLAARARKIVSGDELITAIRSKKVSLVLVASDASDNTKKKISDKCAHYERKMMFVDDSSEISHAIGKNNRMAVGICDEGFANSIEACLKG